MIVITFFIIWFAPGTYPHDLAALVNKKEMLMRKKSPRMIFVGGSSQLTLKSPLIEKALNYSVINMSLWGGLGTREHLKEIKPFLKPGDVIIITMEYGTTLDAQYVKYIRTNYESKKFFFLMSPKNRAVECIHKKEYFTLFKMAFELNQLKLVSFIRNIVTLNFSHLFDKGLPNYSNEFNDCGDRTSPYMIFRPIGDRVTHFSYPKKENHEFLNDFYAYAVQKKARVFFYFSPFPEQYYNVNIQYINAYHEMMKQLLHFSVINKPSDFVYPEKYFADTIYHLNEEGEKIRSVEMIQLIKKAL